MRAVFRDYNRANVVPLFNREKSRTLPYFDITGLQRIQIALSFSFVILEHLTAYVSKMDIGIGYIAHDTTKEEKLFYD